MSFAGTDRAYDRFMGRFSGPLAPLFADFAGIEPPQRVLDVGCGPGALTGELVRRLGEDHVAAVDPTEQFVAACRGRFPAVEVKQAPAEELPFADAAFDAALAQLVVTFMRDAVAGVRELLRVTRPGGVVALCMWVLGPEMEMLDILDATNSAIAPDHPATQAARRYRSEPELLDLFREAGVGEIETGSLVVAAEYAGADELWESIRAGSGPSAEILASLDAAGLARYERELRDRVGERGEPFSLSGRALAIRGRAAGSLPPR